MSTMTSHTISHTFNSHSRFIFASHLDGNFQLMGHLRLCIHDNGVVHMMMPSSLSVCLRLRQTYNTYSLNVIR